jgi:TetR/AcrR family transcriptional regulator
MINFTLDRVDRSVNKVSRAPEYETLEFFNVPEIRSKKMEIRAENEGRILKSAERVFARHGFRGSSMQMISDDASIPKANIHYYFSSKEKLYRRVVERIFTVWLEAADSFETSQNPREALYNYIREKMEISRLHPDGSKVWANEVIHGAPIIHDFLTSALEDWTNSRIAAMHGWIEEGKIRDIEPRWILYMIWATTQHYADFTHQIETLNNGKALSIDQWKQATDSVFHTIWAGLKPED